MLAFSGLGHAATFAVRASSLGEQNAAPTLSQTVGSSELAQLAVARLAVEGKRASNPTLLKLLGSFL